MLVLGLNGSPRRKGNTAFLMNTFMAEAARYAARTRTLVVDQLNITPCKEYTTCETRGTCPIDDDMAREIYGLIREAEVVVTGSPIFFYHMSAQLKALVDRCQLFWGRKYRLKLRDPLSKTRKGFMLGVAASKGKQLFEPMELSTRYFYDAICASWEGSLVYRGMEGATALKKHPGVAEDVAREVEDLLSPLVPRTRVLFVGETNDAFSQMAAAWAQKHFGEKVTVASAGSRPAEVLNPITAHAMAERGVDLLFRGPRDLGIVLKTFQPDLTVVLGAGNPRPPIPEGEVVVWESLTTHRDDLASMGAARDAIEKKVVNLFSDF